MVGLIATLLKLEPRLKDIEFGVDGLISGLGPGGREAICEWGGALPR